MLNNIKSQLINDRLFIKALYELNTPAIVYNYNLLDTVITCLRAQIPKNIKLFYSIKANSNKDLLVFLKNRIDGIDVASIYEFKAGIEAGYKNISATGPSFKSTEIQYIYENNGLFDFNSISQLTNCNEFVKNKEVGIRVPVKNTRYSRFGIDIHNKQFQKFIVENNISIKNIHIHFGEKNPLDLFAILEQLNEIMQHEILSEVTTINMGGGITNLLLKGEIKNFINKLIENKYTNRFEIILEPGRAITSLCGFLITSVIAADNSNTKNEIILDCSAYNLFPWFLPRPISTNSKRAKIIQNLWGNTCFENDYFASRLIFPELNINDKVIFYPVGAYSKNNHKNLHRIPYPNEYSYKNNKLTLIGDHYEYSRD